MTLAYIIEQTLLMMGFTFIVGIAFAYGLKLMTLFFSCLFEGNMSAAIYRNRARGRAYRMTVAHSYNYIRSITRNTEFMKAMPSNPDKEASAILAMDKLAEYHFGTTDSSAKQDLEMTRLYESHYGKI